MYVLSSLIKEKKLQNFIARKKRYRWKSARNRYSVMQIMTAKITALRTPYVQMFPQILYEIVLYARLFLAICEVFSRVLLWLCYRKM